MVTLILGEWFVERTEGSGGREANEGCPLQIISALRDLLNGEVPVGQAVKYITGYTAMLKESREHCVELVYSLVLITRRSGRIPSNPGQDYRSASSNLETAKGRKERI